MRVWLSISGVFEAQPQAVIAGLGRIAAGWGGSLRRARANGAADDFSYVTPSGRHVTVLFPRSLAARLEEFSARLSQEAGAPVFSLRIDDGLLWSASLYAAGAPVARYSTNPPWSSEHAGGAAESWTGDAQAIARHLPHVNAAQIANYFAVSRTPRPRERAYPDDEFTTGDVWQLVDFMRRVGLAYPVRDDCTVEGEAYRIVV